MVQSSKSSGAVSTRDEVFLANQIRWIIVSTAALVVLLRLLVPFQPNFDLSTQLEAAYRLSRGLGLTSQIFALHLPDVVNPPVPQLLTWWPPGLSIVLAAGLLLKLPLALILKGFYGAVTLTGWWGWATLAAPILAKPLIVGWVRLPVQYLVAIVLPLFYSPNWMGTDSILWAGLPYFILLLYQADDHDAKPRFLQASRPLIWAGLLFGVLYGFRYASLMLVPLGLLILCQIHGRAISLIVRQFLLFVGISTVVLVPISLYNRYAAASRLAAAQSLGKLTQVDLSALPSYGAAEGGSTIATLQPVLLHLSGISSLFGMTNVFLVLQSRLQSPIVAALNGVLGIVLLLFVGCLPGFVLLLKQQSRRKNRSAPNLRRDKTLALAVAPICLVGLLGTAMLAYNYPFLRDARYYLPVTGAFVLVTYDLATVPVIRLVKQPLRQVFLAITIVFLLYNVGYRPIAALALGKSASVIQDSVLATSGPVDFGNVGVQAGFKQTKDLLTDLHATYPQAIVYAPQAQFVYDAPDWLRVSIAEGDYWQTAYTSQPIRLIMAVFNGCSWRCFPQAAIVHLAQQPDVKTYTVDSEATTVFVADLPANYQFVP